MKQHFIETHLCRGTTIAVCIVISVLLSTGYKTSGDARKRSSGSLASQLGAAIGLDIRPDSAIWISGAPSEGLLGSIVWHELLFLASTGENQPADLYRVEARALGPHEIFAIRGVRNLSESPLGDEFFITASPPFAAIATHVLGQVRSLTLLDFKNIKGHEGEEWGLITRILSQMTDWLETGRLQGIGKTNIHFTHPPQSASIAFGEKGLHVRWEDVTGKPHSEWITTGLPAKTRESLVVTPTVQLAKKPLLWLVDTVRLLPWVGPGPIEWAEGRFFAIQDFVRRTRYQLVGEETVDNAKDSPAATPTRQSWHLAPGLEIGDNPKDDVWPPPPFEPPVFKRRMQGEGTWVPAEPDFVPTLPGAPPAIMRSVTRPDPARPYLKVELFAMDMRQLKLHMVGGHEDPRSTTGSTGTGRIPDRPEILARVVAAFNGAFKTEHGAYGMIVERDVLLPPQADAATLVSFADGDTAMGSWPKNAAMPDSLESLRQNMDPLVEDGVVNPRRRYLWGFTLDEDITKMHTVRSGICLSDKGYLIYAWGEDLTALTLGTAMNAAGCVYGMHLDMNPFHTSFIYYGFEKANDSGRPKYKAELAIPGMRYSPNRYVNGAPKDFFFLTLRDARPGPEWQAEGLAQPSPAFMPAVFKYVTSGASFLAIDLTRNEASLAHGAIPTPLAPSSRLTDDTADEHLLMVTLPLGTWSSTKGELAKETVVATMADHRATLGIGDAHRITIDEWAAMRGKEPRVRDAIQGTWLDTEEISQAPVIAFGIKEQWLFVGQGSAADIARTFKEQGVERAIAFDTATSDNGPVQIAVRGEKGMLTLDGKPLTTRDVAGASLRIIAAPRRMGATRLSDKLDLSRNVIEKKGTSINDTQPK